MPDTTYPLFESGQTLTATDLNMVRAFLHERDRLVGRMIGFGVNAGLAGTVSGTSLTIQPGLAVDQQGEPLVLGVPQTIALPPTPVTPSYDFIATGPGGFSVVLEAAESVDPAPDCGETDCAGHAEHHTKSVVLRVVSGRLSGTRLDFASEPLLSVEPVRLSVDSSPVNSFTALRDAVADRLTNAGGTPLVSPALITSLRSRTVGTGDSPAVRGYKCGWLNMVLFATLDLLRTEALLRIAANRTAARPGVVLGWVHQVSGTWVFECGYRHQWEPPRGFTEAFLGGSCADPAGLVRDRVEALISGYAPPDPPSGGTGPVGPPTACPPGTIRIGGDCIHVFFPGEIIPELWYEPWLVPLDPLDPIWNPPLEDPGWMVNPWVIYGEDPIDFFDDGQIGGLQYVGQPGAEVQGVLETFIEGGGGFADVRVMPHAAAQGLDGYRPSGSFSPSDTIVLSVNQAGNVVATGRVAAVRNTRRASSALPAVETALVEAQGIAADLGELASGLQTDFGELQQEFQGFKGGAFDQAGYGHRIGTLETQLSRVNALGDRISMLEGQFSQFEEIGGKLVVLDDVGNRVSVLEERVGDDKLGERLSVLEGKIDMVSRASVGGQVKGMSPTVARAFAEFGETTVSAIRTLEEQGSLVGRYARDAERAHARLEVDVASGDPDLIASSALGLMKSMRTMVKAATRETPEGATLGSQLDAQIRAIEHLYG